MSFYVKNFKYFFYSKKYKQGIHFLPKLIGCGFSTCNVNAHNIQYGTRKHLTFITKIAVKRRSSHNRPRRINIKIFTASDLVFDGQKKLILKITRNTTQNASLPCNISSRVIPEFLKTLSLFWTKVRVLWSIVGELLGTIIVILYHSCHTFGAKMTYFWSIVVVPLGHSWRTFVPQFHERTVLTRSGPRSESMTMVVMCCSLTILQKSQMVCGSGSWVMMNDKER